MSKKIKYLIIFLICILCICHNKSTEDIKKVLQTNTFNLLLVLVLINLNDDNLTNVSVYLLFLTIIWNDNQYENFADTSHLKKIKLALKKQIFQIEFKIVPLLKKNIKKYENDIRKTNLNINDGTYKLDNIKSINDINSKINVISKSRYESIKQNISITQNDLQSNPNNIDTNIISLNNIILKDKENLKKMDKSIIDINTNINNKKSSLTLAENNVKDINLQLVKLEEQVDDESKSEDQILIKTDLKNTETKLEIAEEFLDYIIVKIDDQNVKKEELESEKSILMNEIKDSNNKITYLKELKVEIINRIDNFNDICDNKLNIILNNVNKNISFTDKDITDNNIKVKSLQIIQKNKENTIKRIEEKITKINSELTTYQDKRDKLKNQIDELALKIGELENS